MKAEEKAKEWFTMWISDNPEGPSSALYKSLVVLLKEQDRDTRHACASSVQNLDACTPFSVVNAIMNTRSV